MINAGFAEKWAKTNTYREFNRPEVKAAIKQRMAELRDTIQVDQEFLAKGHKSHFEFDVRKLVDKKTGIPIPIQDLDEKTAKAIQGFEVKVTDYYDKKTGSKVSTETRYKYKLVGRRESGDSLAKLLGLREPEEKKLRVSGDLDFEGDLPEEEREALKLGFKFAMRKMIQQDGGKDSKKK